MCHQHYSIYNCSDFISYCLHQGDLSNRLMRRTTDMIPQLLTTVTQLLHLCCSVNDLVKCFLIGRFDVRCG